MVQRRLEGLALGMQTGNFVEAAVEAVLVLAEVFHRDVAQLLEQSQTHMAARQILSRIKRNTPKAAKICEMF